LVEEIITALSRIRWLFVIARNSSFTYKSQAIDVKQVAKQSLKNIARSVRIYRVRLATAENMPKETPTESGPAYAHMGRLDEARAVAPGSDHRWYLAGSIGCGPKSSSRSATSSGRLTVCFGMYSTWASAKISWQPRCAEIGLRLTRLDPGEVDPTHLRRRH
jgi:hypothetical protein